MNVHKNELTGFKQHQAEILQWVLDSIPVHDSALLGIQLNQKFCQYLPPQYSNFALLHILDVMRTPDFCSDGKKTLLSCLWFLVEFPGPAHWRSQNNLVAA